MSLLGSEPLLTHYCVPYFFSMCGIEITPRALTLSCIPGPFLSFTLNFEMKSCLVTQLPGLSSNLAVLLPQPARVLGFQACTTMLCCFYTSNSNTLTVLAEGSLVALHTFAHLALEFLLCMVVLSHITDEVTETPSRAGRQTRGSPSEKWQSWAVSRVH